MQSDVAVHYQPEADDYTVSQTMPVINPNQHGPNYNLINMACKKMVRQLRLIDLWQYICHTKAAA